MEISDCDQNNPVFNEASWAFHLDSTAYQELSELSGLEELPAVKLIESGDSCKGIKMCDKPSEKVSLEKSEKSSISKKTKITKITKIPKNVKETMIHILAKAREKQEQIDAGDFVQVGPGKRKNSPKTSPKVK